MRWGLDELSSTHAPHRPTRPTLVPRVIPVRFAKDQYVFNFFSTVTVLGTPQDVTLQELRIECFFPSDASTAEASRQLARHSR